MNHVEIAYSIPGQTWPCELRWLSTAFARSMVHIEVGVYCGRSFYVSCMGLPRGATAIAVDNDSDPNVGTGFPHPCQDWVKTIRGMTIDSIKKHRPDLNVMSWLLSSIDASRRFSSEIFDRVIGPRSVFIDGSHDYESVVSDIQSWSPMVQNRDSIICGHDYWAANYPVMDAVNHCFSEEEWGVIEGTRIWAKKGIDP